MSNRLRQELYCHDCNQYVQFVMDLEFDGNHVLECPNCGHEHCRVVKDGIITDIRWDSRNGPTIQVYTTSSTTTTYAMYTGTNSASMSVYDGHWLTTSMTSTTYST